MIKYMGILMIKDLYMWFFWKIKSSFGIISETFKSIGKYPILLLPIFITWVMIAALVIYINYYFTFPEVDWQIYLICFLIFWFVSFVLTFTSWIMVEIVRQIETDWNINFWIAFSSNLENIWKLLGLSFIWALLWFILVVIEAILSKAKEKSSWNWNINYEWVARTLGWDGWVFSWLWLQVIKDVLRLAVFLSVPAMLWEKKWVFSWIKEWAKIIWKHPVEFLWIYWSMLLIGILMALPLAIIFSISDSWTGLSNVIWISVIIYEWVIWTFSMYMEQMSTTLLFLWHMKWENQKVSEWDNLKSISKIEKPSLTDDIFEFDWENKI